MEKFVKDEELHNCLKLAIVGKALLHWTNKERQTPEIANIFQKDSNVMYAFQQMKCIQFECKNSPIKNRYMVEHMMQRRKQLSVIALVEIYGEDKCGFILASRSANQPEIASMLKETITGNENQYKNTTEKVKNIHETHVSEKEGHAKGTESKTSGVEEETEAEGRRNTSTSTSSTTLTPTPIGWIGYLQNIAMFGYEDPNSVNFTWFKWFLRIVVDFIVFGGLSYYLANAITSHPEFRNFIENRIIASNKVELTSAGCDNDVEQMFSAGDMNDNSDIDIFQEL